MQKVHISEWASNIKSVIGVNDNTKLLNTCYSVINDVRICPLTDSLDSYYILFYFEITPLSIYLFVCWFTSCFLFFYFQLL